MKRLSSFEFIAIAATTAMAFLSLEPEVRAATAFDVTVELPAGGRPIDALLPGDEFSLAIRLSGSGQIFALDASAFGYDESVVDFVSGEAVPFIGYPLPPALCLTVVSCSLPANFVVPEALRNLYQSGPVTESAIGAHGNRALFVRALSLSAFSTQAHDPGLEGPFDTSGGAQFRLVFRASGIGRAVINIGTGYSGDGEVGPGGVLDTSANTPIVIQVIPEPSTSFMMGLGLIGLSSCRQRETEPRRTRGPA